MSIVSIVIACYNSSKTIYRCWESLKNQTYGLRNLECIFVDDASSDNGRTLNMLYEIEKEAPDNVIVIASDRNMGPGGALNLGISYASGDYLQILDSDDELAIDAIEKLYDIASKYDADIIQYNHTLILGDRRRVNRVSRGNKLYVINDHDQRTEFLNATLVTYGRSNKFYRMKLVKETGVYFAENVVYEEPLFVYPLFLYAKRVYLCEDGFYYYYLHGGSIVTSQIGQKLLDHPRVQLMLLKDCMERADLYAEYVDVISCYFLWSYYCETLLFASENCDATLPIDFLREMQLVCRKLYPNFENNPQIRRINDRKTIDMLNSIKKDFYDQKELDEYISSLRETDRVN